MITLMIKKRTFKKEDQQKGKRDNIDDNEKEQQRK